jgi:hypothetical protein
MKLQVTHTLTSFINGRPDSPGNRSLVRANEIWDLLQTLIKLFPQINRKLS